MRLTHSPGCLVQKPQREVELAEGHHCLLRPGAGVRRERPADTSEPGLEDVLKAYAVGGSW